MLGMKTQGLSVDQNDNLLLSFRFLILTYVAPRRELQPE
jgi:hypothetical protein